MSSQDKDEPALFLNQSSAEWEIALNVNVIHLNKDLFPIACGVSVGFFKQHAFDIAPLKEYAVPYIDIHTPLPNTDLQQHFFAASSLYRNSCLYPGKP